MRWFVALVLGLAAVTASAAGLKVKGITLGAPPPAELSGRLAGSNGVLADTYLGQPAQLFVRLDREGNVGMLTFRVRADAVHGIASDLTRKYGAPRATAGSFAWNKSDTEILLIPTTRLGEDAQLTFTYVGGPRLDPRDM
ncbi:hypothetical protein [Dyella sp. C11]|uniref:hypothetical protein n=1 Tax=Dyella sp. C11 TaxID=2126991 RepID=UPI000D65C636|nr:hypothetical protein [Dyella sp. C11]